MRSLDEIAAQLAGMPEGPERDRLRAEYAEAITRETALESLAAESTLDEAFAVLDAFAETLTTAKARAIGRERMIAAAKSVKAISSAAKLVDGLLGSRPIMTRSSNLSTEDPDPATEPQNTATLLEELTAVLERHVVFPAKVAVIALALWILHTWAIDAADYTPRLIIRSPAPRCGKSLLLDILGMLCRRALASSNTSSAMIYRVVEAEAPTLLLDEVDTYFTEREELRGITNAGYSRSMGYVTRVHPESLAVEKFRCFAPVALAGIGRLPPTVEDRSIAISLARKPKSTEVVRFRRAERSALTPLPPRLARWASDAVPTLKSAEPAVPDALNDRAADIWEPLLAIADLAGSRWPVRAREAAVALAGAADAEGITDRNIRLLAAVRSIYEPPAPEAGAAAPDPCDRLSLESIVSGLLADTSAGWSEYKRGKPITTSDVASVLRGFGAGLARQWRPGADQPRPEKGERVRGYRRADLSPIWGQYLDECPIGGDGTYA